jgi:S1-C subfamily serine protease
MKAIAHFLKVPFFFAVFGIAAGLAWSIITNQEISAEVAIPPIESLLSRGQSEVSRTKKLAWRSEEEQRIIKIYKQARESVVNISTEYYVADPFDLFMQRRPRSIEGSGSGVIVDSKKGLILTNLHVIEKAQEISVALFDGRSVSARVIGYDRPYDLAVLQLERLPQELSSLQFGDSSSLDVGQKVLAIGNPHGLDSTLTTGIVSSLDRTVRVPGGSLMKGLLQTDAAINPGNSGGPLIDLSGQLIGINTAILSQSGDSAGIGFAVPINLVKRVLPELITTGKVSRPYFGWLLTDTRYGPLVRRTFDDGPADKEEIAALERVVQERGVGKARLVVDRDLATTDFIVSVNGKKVSNVEEIGEIVSKLKKGESLRFGFAKARNLNAVREMVLTPVWK